jgi:ABC-type oligopeptide transport system substrate-binding subunit
MVGLRVRIPRPWLALVLVVLAPAVLLAACERRSRETVSESRSVLRRSLGAEPATLDPQLAEDNASLAVVADLYEGLTRVAADGSVVAGAAARWEQSADRLTYTFHLRPGLTWSNGDALTAAHFAAGLARATASDSVAPNRPLLEALTGIEPIDDRTLRLTLSRPVLYLPALLALPVAMPLHPDARAVDERPVNGAYVLAGRIAGEKIELARNERFYDAATVAIDSVVHLPLVDLGAEVARFRTDALDLTSEVPNSQFAFLREKLPDRLHVDPYLSVYAYAVNFARLPSREMRGALSRAIDRERITSLVTGAGERAAYGWVPDGLPGYVPARYAWAGQAAAERASAARTAWRTATAAAQFSRPLVLCTDASDNHHRTAVALADMWRATLGVEVRMVELEWNVYLETRRAPGDCDLVRLGWSADFVDPEAFLGLFESGHPQNTLGYSSPAYDRLLAASREASDEVQRRELLAGADAQLLEDVPVIPVFFRVAKRLVQPWVDGYRPNPLGQIASRDLALRPRETKRRAGTDVTRP